MFFIIQKWEKNSYRSLQMYCINNGNTKDNKFIE